MRIWFDENIGSKMSEPDCVDEWLFEIWAVGCDYDGCGTVEELKGTCGRTGRNESEGERMPPGRQSVFDK